MTKTKLIKSERTAMALTGASANDARIRAFNRWLEGTDLNVSLDAIQQFLSYLKDERSLLPNSLHAYRSSLKAGVKKTFPIESNNVQFLAALDKAFAAIKVPKINYRINPENDCLTSDEIKTLLVGLEGEGRVKLALFIKFLYLTGSRINESLEAKVRNVRIKQNTAIIRYTTTKTNREIEKTIPIRLFNDIKETFHSRTFLFENGGRKFSRQNFFIQIQKAGKRLLNREDCGCHILRRSGATNLLRDLKCDIQQVKDYCNHSDISTTLRYYSFNSLSFKDVENLERLIGI